MSSLAKISRSNPYLPAPPAAPPRDAIVSGDVLSASRRYAGSPLADALGATSASSASSAEPKVRHYTDTKLPTRAEHLMMSRFAWGYSRETMRDLRAAGSPEEWFDKQLDWKHIHDPVGDSFDTWYPGRMKNARKKWHDNDTGKKYAWEVAVDLANWSLLKRSRSKRQLLEVMTDFWSNHFHIPAIDDLSWAWRNHYDAMLRHRAFGNFDDLLLAVSLHPTMLLYLGNYESTKYYPNENQGRELLELHSVGIDGGYTEDGVVDSARILTGFTVNAWYDWKPRYDASVHYTGRVKVLGFSSPNKNEDGRKVAREYIRYLAHHPKTARHIATKLALRFVSDHPSDRLIDDLAHAFTKSGTNIRATLHTLIRHPEFQRSAGKKVRNPIEDFVATVRALDVRARQPKPSDGWPFAEAQIWMCRGQYPFQWPRPDGLPQTNDAWASASQVLGALDTHYSMAGGWVGDAGTVHFKQPVDWLPQKKIRFDLLVDHLSRMVLGIGATSRLLRAASQATGVPASDIIDKDHAIVQWLMPRLMTAVLDTPAHMSR